MNNKRILGSAVLAVALAGCSSAPGNSKQQGAVIGGASGAAVGAAVSKNNRALGAIIGGAVGAAGGYVIGQKTGTLDHPDNNSTASGTPASTESGTSSSNGPTADSNKDGFVTLDEVVDMEKRGVSDEEMIERLRATGQKFDLEDNHREYLRQRGVSERVISELPMLNRARTTQRGDSVIGR
jgi:hypothetical protein